MPGEVRIHVDVDATRQYVFMVRSGRRQITTIVNSDLGASFYEDLRLTRWKSAGVHDPGDVLLNHVGERLAALIAPPATWEELRLPDDALHVRVQFTQAAHRLMPFPWELLRVNERFLIGAQGSHVVRHVPAPGGTRRRRPVRNVVHISFGTDSALRFDEERCTLLETLPVSIPIEFLIDPSPGHLQAVMDVFRPHIVIVSGHGHYDDLRGEHYLSTGNNQFVPTAHCRRKASCCLRWSSIATSTESGNLITRGLSVFVDLKSRISFVWVSERAIVTRPSLSMSDHRKARISPRRDAVAATTRRNIERHQMLVAASNSISS
jgi:hypothetical protein